MAISEKRRLTYTSIAVAVTGVVTGLILGVALFSGGTAPSAADSSPTSSAQASPSPEGAGELFAANCAVCHGNSREGVLNLAPALTQQSLAELSDTEIRDTISGGRLTAGMPSFKAALSAAEIDALLQFIRNAAP
ncbi:MAG: cytochrome c [Dehalococcoidia bacterium]